MLSAQHLVLKDMVSGRRTIWRQEGGNHGAKAGQIRIYGSRNLSTVHAMPIPLQLRPKWLKKPLRNPVAPCRT
eukprot:9867218-Ditylum_brightwellii.AAC.1